MKNVRGKSKIGTRNLFCATMILIFCVFAFKVILRFQSHTLNGLTQTLPQFFQLFQIESTSLQESLGWSSYDDMKEHEHFLGLFTNC